MKKTAYALLLAMLVLVASCTQYVYIPVDTTPGGGNHESTGPETYNVTDINGLNAALRSAAPGDKVNMNISTDTDETPTSSFPIQLPNGIDLSGSFRYTAPAGANGASVLSFSALNAAPEEAAETTGITLFAVADTASVSFSGFTATFDETTAAEVASVISVNTGKLTVDSLSVEVESTEPATTVTAPVAISLGTEATTETLTITNTENVEIAIDENNGNKTEISTGLPDTVATTNDAATYDEFVEQLTATGTVRLTDDITQTLGSTFQFPGEHSVYSINLNKHTLSITGPGSIEVPDGAELDMRNGTFNLTNTTAANGSDSNLVGGDAATISLNKVTYTGSHTAIFPSSNKVVINVIDSTVIAKGVFGIGTNAAQPVVQGEIINIVHSTVRAEAENGDCVAVMINVPGTLTISEGSTISGGRQGVIVRGGTANISDSTIESRAKFEGQPSFVDEKYWNSGNEVAYAALCVGSYTTSAYDYPSTVTVTNTKITMTENERKDTSRIAVGCAIEENVVTLNLDNQDDVDEANNHKSVDPGFADNITINLIR